MVCASLVSAWASMHNPPSRRIEDRNFIFGRLYAPNICTLKLISLRHSVNEDFCRHSSFVLWHQNLTTFVSWTFAKSESCGKGGGGIIS